MAEINTGGTPNPDVTSGAGGGQQQQAAIPATGPTSGAAATGGQTPAEKVFSYKEDRTDWTPRHRLNEESGKRTAAEKERDAAKAENEKLQQRLRIAMGVETVDPKTAEQQEVKQVLTGILQDMGLDIDTLKTLNKAQLEKVMRAAEAAQTTSEQQWARQTNQAFESVESEVVRQMGVQKLSPKQIDQLRRAYVAEADACMQAREQAVQFGTAYDADNDFMARHLRNDPSLAKEFAKAFLDEWVEPIRRTVTSQQVRRGSRPVPGGGRSQDLTISNQPVGNLDNKDDFKKALIAARKASGG